MPIYEYACQKCGKRTEAIQRVRERPLKICPHCGGPLKKLASAPAIQFKGSGWYVTDYARAKKESGKAEDRSASSGNSESGEKAEKRESAEKATEKSGEKAEKAEKAAQKSGEKLSEKPAEKKKEKKAKE